METAGSYQARLPARQAVAAGAPGTVPLTASPATSSAWRSPGSSAARLPQAVPGLALIPFPDLACHLGQDPGFHLPGRKRLDDGDEAAVPGDKGGLAGLLDLVHDAGGLLVEITHGVDESLTAIDLSKLETWVAE